MGIKYLQNMNINKFSQNWEVKPGEEETFMYGMKLLWLLELKLSLVWGSKNRLVKDLL